jgi:hypothetical protein
MKKININFLKLALKTELKWFIRTKRSLLLTTGGLLIPCIAFLPGNDIQGLKTIMSPIIIILIALLGIFGQYFYDSICKDIINKVNIFYSNINIPKRYSYFAKVIICTPFFILLFIYNWIFDIQISFLLIGIYFAYIINVSICSYVIVNLLFSPKNTSISLYAPFLYSYPLAYLLGLIGINYMSLMLQLILIIFWIIISKHLLSLKKISTNMF